ncbi:MAG TPA: hypothetical protein PKA51_10810 [Kiritimatiellia bacterium]|nr:hypothetical protein [Kiritimatiellia bacterium]
MAWVVWMAVPVLGGPAQVQISQSSLNPGFTINAPGSYILTENLYATSGVAVITVMTNDVLIDLNGHTISAATNVAHGIRQIDGVARITVKNGSLIGFRVVSNAALHLPGNGSMVQSVRLLGCRESVRAGMDSLIHDTTIMGIGVLGGGGFGVRAGDHGRIVRVEVKSVQVSGAFTGVEAGERSVLRQVSVLNCSGGSPFTAIRAGQNSVITESRAGGNAGGTFVTGITAGSNSVIRASAADRNSGTFLAVGISLVGPGVVADSRALHQAGGGISAGPGAVVVDNLAHSNALVGITLDGSSIAFRNVMSMNGFGAGGIGGIAAVQPGNVMDNNVAIGNARGIQLTSGNNLVIGNRTSANSVTNIAIIGAPNHVGLRRNVTTSGFVERNGMGNINY